MVGLVEERALDLLPLEEAEQLGQTLVRDHEDAVGLALQKRGDLFFLGGCAHHLVALAERAKGKISVLVEVVVAELVDERERGHDDEADAVEFLQQRLHDEGLAEAAEDVDGGVTNALGPRIAHGLDGFFLVRA